MVRARILLAAILVFFLYPAFGQKNQVVRVGVAPLENRSSASAPSDVERDRLVLAINQLKPDKKTHLKLEAVALEGETGNDVTDDAVKKNCDYVVYPMLLKLSELEPGVLQPGTVTTDPSSIVGPPTVDSQTMRTEYEATAAFKLYNIKGHSTISRPALTGIRHPFEQEAVSEALDRVVLSVFDVIKKGGQTHPMEERY